MKKLKMHKFKLTILAVLIAMLGIFTITGTNAASSAPTTFTADSEKLLEGYIDNWHYGKLTSSLGGYVYCRDMNLGIPYGVTMTLEGEAPAAIAYILSNGFPRTSITGNDDMDYYITQAAIWWYLDETTGSNNLPDSFKYTGSDPYNIRHYIVELVEGGKKQTSYATPAISLVNNDSTLNLTSDKKYYESNAISVKTLYTTGNYTISLSNAPGGTTVVNASTGSPQNSFSPSESFKVRIPVDSVDIGSLNVTVTATATGSINKAYMYESSDSSKQDVMGSLVYPETSTVTDQTNLTLETSKVTITKIDADTEEPLAGATFELKDSSGKVVATWTSTTSSHVIKNLPNGTYTVEETKAPDGYELSEEVVKFTIDDNSREQKIKFYNEAKERVVNIIKVDQSTGNPLAGAVIVVKDADGKEVARFTSTTDPYVLTGLKDGTYTVEEVSAPSGYQKSNEVYSFTLDAEHVSHQITIENAPIVEVPNTGVASSILLVILGLGIIGGGIRFVQKNSKQRV